MTTHIEWTDETWNPTTGCDRVSPGCDNCYAMTLAKRLKGMGSEKYQRDGDPRTSGPGFGLTVHPDALDLPLRWRKPRRVFVNSMSDLFHKDVPDEFIVKVFAVMGQAGEHTFQVLTKRPQRMAVLLASPGWREALQREMWEAETHLFAGPVLPNVWLGTSIESQRYADLRIPHLLATPAAVHFLSCEPLLGPVDLSESLSLDSSMSLYGVPGAKWVGAAPPLLDWVICGGESGLGARPMHPDWARSLRDQCQAAGVPYFFKQWGEWGWPARTTDHALTIDGRLFEPGARLGMDHMMQPTFVRRVGKKAAGRELDDRTWDEFPG